MGNSTAILQLVDPLSSPYRLIRVFTTFVCRQGLFWALAQRVVSAWGSPLFLHNQCEASVRTETTGTIASPPWTKLVL